MAPARKARSATDIDTTARYRTLFYQHTVKYFSESIFKRVLQLTAFFQLRPLIGAWAHRAQQISQVSCREARVLTDDDLYLPSFHVSLSQALRFTAWTYHQRYPRGLLKLSTRMAIARNRRPLDEAVDPSVTRLVDEEELAEINYPRHDFSESDDMKELFENYGSPFQEDPHVRGKIVARIPEVMDFGSLIDPESWQRAITVCALRSCMLEHVLDGDVKYVRMADLHVKNLVENLRLNGCDITRIPAIPRNIGEVKESLAVLTEFWDKSLVQFLPTPLGLATIHYNMPSIQTVSSADEATPLATAPDCYSLSSSSTPGPLSPSADY